MAAGVSFSIPATNGTSGHATTQTSLFIHVPTSPSTATTIFDYDLSAGDYFRLYLSATRHLILEFQKTGYGSASVDGGAVPVGTWVWISAGFSTSGGLHLRLDVTASGGGTTTVSALASSGSATGLTQTGVPFGVGVSVSSVYIGFPNNDAAGWLCSQLLQNQIASNASAGNPEPMPSTEFGAGADYREYLAHDPLGAAVLLTDSGTGGIDMNAGPLGLTITNDGPPLRSSSAGPAGAHEGDITIYKSGSWQSLPIGTSGQELTVVGGDPAWTTKPEAAATTEGDLLYYHTSALARLAVGAGGKVLLSDGTDPYWGDVTSGAATRWEPLTNPSVPDLIFDATGNVIMVEVAP